MPTCPECGHAADASADWFRTVDSQRTGGHARERQLIVCPDCDVVIGGTVSEVSGRDLPPR